jgi:cysteine desulfurase
MSILEVDKEGHVSLEKLKQLLRINTFLVSVGLANGEIGTIQPMAKIGRIISQFKKEHSSLYPYLHTDASQAPNYLSVYAESLQVDLLTLDAAKIYGPKGIGVLAVRRGVALHPLIFGGGQEGGRRSGTLNPALIAGLATALEKALRDRVEESLRLEALRKYFIEHVEKCLPNMVINGSTHHHLPNIISLSLPGMLSEWVLLKLEEVGVLVSVGSACSYDNKISGSPVIRALGRNDLAEATLRFSLGRSTSLNDVKSAVKRFCLIVESVVK